MGKVSPFLVLLPESQLIAPPREEIGILTSLPLLRNVVGDLEEARNNELPLFTAYFTKESHIHTLVNLVVSSGLPITLPRISELDYLSHIT
jgi:inositol hexakisphosphate/diphosphoinositol-pentakisphosphate kinase